MKLFAIQLHGTPVATSDAIDSEGGPLVGRVVAEDDLSGWEEGEETTEKKIKKSERRQDRTESISC